MPDNFLPNEGVVVGSCQEISLQGPTDMSLAGGDMHFSHGVSAFSEQEAKARA